MSVELIGYRYSVYLWIARVVLEEKGVAFAHVEVDPFAGVPDWYLGLHPFGRVPVLRHGDFTLYETAAIARYVDAAFAGESLVPLEARAAGRMQQVIGIVDSYGYRPMVRQVFAHAVFRPRTGAAGEAGEIAAGLEASAGVLAALEGLAGDDWLVGDRVCLADLHLGPMMAYFVAAPQGAAMLAGYPRLSAWWARMRVRPCMVASDPGLP
ncbi:MAG: glutathione S-transferase family protein [Alphaproteobacteria bacterium]|nr:glutathione S-transferase family protein [Alphaproteobacteria bacterium]